MGKLREAVVNAVTTSTTFSPAWTPHPLQDAINELRKQTELLQELRDGLCPINRDTSENK